MKIRIIIWVILLMMFALCTGCSIENVPFAGGVQCPEGTAPVMVTTPDGETIIDCVPVE